MPGRSVAQNDVADLRAERLRKAALAMDAVGQLLLELAALEAPAADPLLTVAEAAAEMRYSEAHIKAACARKQIAAIKAGGWRMRLSALRDYERRLTQGGARSRKGAA